MTATQATKSQPIAALAAALAMVTAATFLIVHDNPAQASHGNAIFIEIGESSTPATANAGAEFPFLVTLIDATSTPVNATVRTLILMEVEGTPNDSDTEPGSSYGTPEGFCAINAGEGSCNVPYTFTIGTAFPTSPEKLRFWVNGHPIDAHSDGATGEGTQEGSAAGCMPEPDTTELIDVVVIGSPTGTPPTHIPPVAGASPNPATCENTTGTPTASGTPTDTGSPTPTDSGTPTDTGSPTPTDSGSPTPTQSQTGGPGATMTIATSPRIGVWGTDFVISGEVRCNGILVPDATVQIFRRFAGSGSSQTSEAQTDVQGRYALRNTDLPASAYYSGAWRGNATCTAGADTGPQQAKAEVRPGVTANARDQTLRRGDTAVFSGKVLPGHAGKKVMLQTFSGSPQRWRFHAEARLSSTSTYTVFYRKTAPGFILFRVAYATQDLDHVWNISRNLRIDWS